MQGLKFHMGKRTKRSFQEIKTPVLHFPDNKGRFHVYSDASKFATGSVLY